jgi:hypothetical protein
MAPGGTLLRCTQLVGDHAIGVPGTRNPRLLDAGKMLHELHPLVGGRIFGGFETEFSPEIIQ